MKSWRPVGWQEIKKANFPDDPWQGFEAGADAMLEALRKEGKYIDASKYPHGLVLNDIVPVQKLERSFKGWLIIIPTS